MKYLIKVKSISIVTGRPFVTPRIFCTNMPMRPVPTMITSAPARGYSAPANRTHVHTASTKLFLRKCPGIKNHEKLSELFL